MTSTAPFKMTEASLTLLAATEDFLQRAQEYRFDKGPDFTGPPALGGTLQSSLCAQYPNWGTGISSNIVGVVTPALPIACIPEMPDCLARLLHCVNQDELRSLRPVSHILVAVERHRCLPYFLKIAPHCYDLAIACLLYVTLTLLPLSLPSGLNEAEDLFVCQLLNEWLHPAQAWLTPPSEVELAEHLFGTAWVLFAGNGETALLCDVVKTELPPFLPGICLAQVDDETPLPDTFWMAL